MVRVESRVGVKDAIRVRCTELVDCEGTRDSLHEWSLLGLAAQEEKEERRRKREAVVAPEGFTADGKGGRIVLYTQVRPRKGQRQPARAGAGVLHEYLRMWDTCSS